MSQAPPPPRDSTTDGTTPESSWDGYVAAVLITFAISAIGWPLFHKFGVENETILMLYLVGVLWVATHYSRGATILTSILAVGAFDFFFVPPYNTFVVSHRQYIVTFVVMIVTALVISTLTHRVREQVAMARQRERRTAALLVLSRALAAGRTVQDIAAATVWHVSEVLGQRTALFLVSAEGRLVLKADSAGGTADAAVFDVAQWVLNHNESAGRGMTRFSSIDGTLIPLRASRGTIGVLGMLGSSNGEQSIERQQLSEAFASQAASAVERAILAEEAAAAWERVEAEFLRNTLLSGVSHDLRTPLAAITGAVSSLTETGDSLSANSRSEMLSTIYSESERMERLITNLLEMTRLESGGLTLQKEWQPLQEVVGSALHHMDRRLRGREVQTDLPTGSDLVLLDGTAVEQVLVNLLDNALQYTPSDSRVQITATLNEHRVTVEVADRGPGLPPGAEDRLFDKFFRASPVATEAPRGIGLGLAICRGIVEAHGGQITASNRDDGGAVFRFTLPRGGTPPIVDNTA